MFGRRSTTSSTDRRGCSKRHRATALTGSSIFGQTIILWLGRETRRPRRPHPPSEVVKAPASVGFARNCSHRVLPPPNWPTRKTRILTLMSAAQPKERGSLVRGQATKVLEKGSLDLWPHRPRYQASTLLASAHTASIVVAEHPSGQAPVPARSRRSLRSLRAEHDSASRLAWSRRNT